MENIALAFSGGGFRAAAFSLGTLAYLETTPYCEGKLIEKVKFIGSTSGGSITNIAYSSALCGGHPFEQTYAHLMDALKDDGLIRRVFELLRDDAEWKKRPEKSRNLINAFSLAYDELLYPDCYFGIYSQKITGTHLEEVCINATEFANGISYRFHSQHPDSSFPRGRIGNNYIYYLRDRLAVADQLKLADILACSSCFSGGFEPFIFPDDFTYGGLDSVALSAAVKFTDNPFKPVSVAENTKAAARDLLGDKDFKKEAKRFGIMDGGVADNQAIDSVLLSNDRRRKKGLPVFDLILVSDVTSYFMDGYTLPLEKRSYLGSATLYGIASLLVVIGLAAPVFAVWALFDHWYAWMNLAVLPSVLLLLLALKLSLSLTKAREAAWEDKSTWLIMLFSYGEFFLHIRVSTLTQMLLSRLKSVLLLADDIYLKQIRRHYYQMLYSDKELSKITVSNAIYDLSAVKQKLKEDDAAKKVIGFDSVNAAVDEKIPAPEPKLVAVAEKARLMDTTLWFDEFQQREGVLKAIVATGQFTVCYNLLRFLYQKDAAALSAEEQALKVRLLADWKLFNADPYRLYDQLQPAVAFQAAKKSSGVAAG